MRSFAVRLYARPLAPSTLARAVILAVLALTALPPAAGAVLPGANGKIIFASGRDDGATAFTDATAQIWMIDGSTGSNLTRVTTTANGIRHQHPTWSPDRTMIAYGKGPQGDRDIWIHNLLNGNAAPLRTTPGVDDDRPQWSPDGTRIAYRSANDIVIDTVPAPGAMPLNLTSSADIEDRPAWTPDSQTIFYSFDASGAPIDNDIRKEFANGSQGAGTGVITGTTSDFQPNLSADGQKLCFTRGGFDDTADLWTADTSAPNTNLKEVGLDPAKGEYNCVWSPDGTRIAFAYGQFGTAQLVSKSSDGTGSRFTISDDPAANRFDGNADWAPDASPVCQNGNATVTVNGSASIPLKCAAQGPAYEQSLVARVIFTSPSHGVLGTINQGSVTYTPSRDFQGTDSFTFRGRDKASASSAATVTITVAKDVAANISSFKVSPKTWKRGSGLPVISATQTGTTISWSLSEPARVTLTFLRAEKGRKVGGKCRKPSKSNRNRTRCTRYVKKGTLGLNGKQGPNKVKFKGRITSQKRLSTGKYRVTIDARDPTGHKSEQRRASFTIVKG